MISVSNFQSIKGTTDDRMVHFECYSWIPGLIHPLHFCIQGLDFFSEYTH